MRVFGLLLSFALVLILIPSLVVAGSWLYMCDVLPTSAGWDVPPTDPSNCYENGGGITSTIESDGGSNAWKMVDAGATSRGLVRNGSLGNLSYDTGASLAANLRCAANSSDSSYTLGVTNGGVGAMFLCIKSDRCYLVDLDGATHGSVYTFASDTTGYHRYYLTAMNDTLGNNDTCRWNVYRDGQLVISYLGLGDYFNGDTFYAGHGGSTGTGTWYFDWIAGNNSGAFSPAQWDPSGPPPAPTVTGPSNGSTVMTPTPTIQWVTASSDAYEVHVNTTNNSADADGWDSGEVSSAANSCVTGSLANSLYYVFVRLHGNGGWGPWSAADYSFTVNAPTAPPDAPIVTTPTGGSTITTYTTSVAWTGDAHDAYEVHINTTNVPDDADGWDSGQVVNAGSSCVSGDLANNSYYVFVRLRNVVGWGAWSAGVNFTIYLNAALPGAPRTITPPDSGNVITQTPVIRWIGDPHTHYEVHINTTNVPSNSDSWDSGQVSSADDWCDAGILANGVYHVFVRLRNADGWGPWSDGHTFTINSTGAEMKNGWIFLEDDQPYNLELLSHAREYHVNQLQISHDIMMYAYEPINDLTRRARINQLIDTAHANGITEVTLWVHDIMTTNMPSYLIVNGKINLDDPRFWTWLDSLYEQLFTVCPNADGIIMTYSESAVDFDSRSLVTHTGKSPIDTYEQAIRTVWEVCKRHNKSLYIRTWGSDRWIRDALLRNDPAIWMMSKATGPADWQHIQEDYSIIGTATGHPELEEFDYAGEYWGKASTPWAGIDYIHHLWTEFALPRGVKGMAARLGRDTAGVYETPARINMTAQDMLVDYPDCPSDDIYQWWGAHWFGASGPKVASSMKRAFEITNACNNLPPVYPLSKSEAFENLKASMFDLNCVKASLLANTTYQPGMTAYDLFRGKFINAQTQLGQGSVPSTLFGDFTMAAGQANPTCSATVVDVTSGLNPSLFRVEYSTNSGATWTNYTNFSVVASGGSVNPYCITANSVPFGQLRAGSNKIRVFATNLASTQSSQVFTARGLDNAYVTLGSSIVSDGITHPQGGDGDTVATTAGGRSCRTPATSADVYMYFRSDEGYAHDLLPETVYLQVDYYGSSGSIRPYYDSYYRTDQPLSPVYLSGGTTWRTASWRLDGIGFQRRLSGNDLALYVGSANGVIFISSVRLSYAPPAGMLLAPSGLSATTAGTNRVDLAWNAVPGANRYQVCRNGAAIGWPTGTTYSNTGLTANTQYAYTVTAFDASDNTSPSAQNVYATTLSVAPSTSTITSNPLAATWQTSSSVVFTAVGGFGAGKVAYYQYVWDESPTYSWTGNEPSWPGLGAPTGSGWNVWRATETPINIGPWLMYEGDPTQRTNSVESVLENGVPTWRYNDQGRVFGTKAKIGLWPNLSISRDTGVTIACRMRCIDEPSGWYNVNTNFGLNMLDAPDVGITVMPGSVLGIDGSSIPASNGYDYHTYTLTLKNVGGNSTYTLYRDGAQLASTVRGPSGSSTWSGPFFGHWRSDAMGGWAWQWIAWNNTGAYVPSTGTTLTATAPHYGSSYYLHVRGFNSEGASNGTINLGPYYYWNGSTPVAPNVTDDGAYTTQNAIHAKWTVAGPSVIRYEYAIGTSPGAQNTLPFTSAGMALEVTHTGLNLIEGQTYYFSVRGVSAGGNGAVGTSDGIAVAPTVDGIAEAKMLTDSSPAALYGKTVTAIFSDCAYIQEPSGAGMRIVTSRPISAGQTVDIAGVMAGASAERYVQADAVIAVGTGTIEAPSVPGRSIGGQDFLYNGTSGQRGLKAYMVINPQPGYVLSYVPGLNNIGSLVRAYGKVTWVGTDEFYLDDGSSYSDFSIASPKGVKVVMPLGAGTPALNSYITLTGIVSCYESGGTFYRLLRVRQAGDVVTLL